MSIDQNINAAFEPFANKFAEVIFYSVALPGGHDVKLVLIWLVAAALFFTFYLGFINLRFFKHAVDLVRGKADGQSGDGQISRFQALATSLSGTIGLGNIAGVAVAISVGGPGAAFWMAFMGFFGMSTKFAEVALGVKYRQHLNPEDPASLSGGPMYYIKAAFDKFNLPFVGSVLGGSFALFTALGAIGAASLFQTNQVFQQALNITGGPEASFLAGKGWVVGLLMLFLVGLVIIGGIRSIAAVTSKVVPFMGLLYIVAGMTVIAMHAADIPAAFVTIFEAALTMKAGFGALLGGFLMGVQRASFSNEAGFGSAAIAHAEVKTNEPVSQGFVGMLGPFIDTIVICMVTALLIVVTGVYVEGNGIEGVELTSRAFAAGLPWFPYVLFVVVFLFAYSTLISWSYYGVKAFTYLFGENKINEVIYKVIFCFFIVIGASAQLDSVILFTDASVFSMAIPNIIGLYLLAPELRRDVKAYIQKIRA